MSAINFDTLNRSGLAMLADPHALVAARGGADSMYANDPGKLLACNKWVDHARPIIKAMFVLEDEADWPLLSARVEADKGRSWQQPVSWQVRDYDEARDTIKDAHRALFEMLDGIRDNFISDERCGIGDTDDETEAADEFNDWLEANTLSVDAAIKLIAAEHDATLASIRAGRSTNGEHA